jgi:SAM-dependent methyltransferase
MENVNDSYFDGHYKDIWRTIIPEQLTVKETEFMLEYFHLQAGSRVLDLMCGYGRHALALGRKGIEVWAIDNQGTYIAEINDTAIRENLPVRALNSPILDYSAEGVFDLAICMGNSLNFFNAQDTVKLLSKVSSSLKIGGQLLINSWSLTEIATKQFIERSWTELNGLRLLSDSKYLFHPTRIETDSFFIQLDGKTENRKAIDYVFSVSEMESMLIAAGFRLREVYSIPGRKKFALGELRAYLVAEKG